jgi:hypothetical protein
MSIRKQLALLGTVCLLTGLVAAPALAGGNVFAGLSLPTGDFGDAASMGYHLGGAVAFPMAPLFNVGVRAAYNRWGWEDDVDGNFSTIEALAFAKVSAPAGPFGMVGIGLSSSDAEQTLPGEPTQEFDRQTDFAWALGGGYGMTMFEITLLYHSISTEGDATNYFTLSAGLGF